MTIFVTIFDLFGTLGPSAFSCPYRDARWEKRWPPAWAVDYSNMVSQLEFQGVRVEIVLLLEVRLIVETYVVIDEGYRNDEGDMPLAIVVDDLKQLPLGIGRELLFEITHNVLQDIAMFRRRGLEAQGLH